MTARIACSLLTLEGGCLVLLAAVNGIGGRVAGAAMLLVLGFLALAAAWVLLRPVAR